MPNKKKLDFDVKRYLVAEVLYPDHVVPLHVGEWDPPGAKIRILIRLLLVSIHFNDRSLCFIDVIYFLTSIFVLSMLGSRYS